MSKTRFEAFSDGVFAIAITLLVLGFAVPQLRAPVVNRDLAAGLSAMWPHLVAYALSFGVIGIMWQNHHALFRLVSRIDRTTIFLNLLLLGGTAFIPFATDVLGAHPTLAASTVLYGITLSFCATIYNLLLTHLIRSGAFGSAVNSATLQRTVRAYRTGLAGYGAATLIGVFVPAVSFAAYLAIALYYVIPHGVDADIDSSASS